MKRCFVTMPIVLSSIQFSSHHVLVYCFIANSDNVNAPAHNPSKKDKSCAVKGPLDDGTFCSGEGLGVPLLREDGVRDAGASAGELMKSSKSGNRDCTAELGATCAGDDALEVAGAKFDFEIIEKLSFNTMRGAPGGGGGMPGAVDDGRDVLFPTLKGELPILPVR
jgi:uncharacterized membrane protein